LRTAQRIFGLLRLQSWKYAGYCLEWKNINKYSDQGDSPRELERDPCSHQRSGPFSVSVICKDRRQRIVSAARLLQRTPFEQLFLKHLLPLFFFHSSQECREPPCLQLVIPCILAPMIHASSISSTHGNRVPYFFIHSFARPDGIH
jgi:hypothetical protein